MERLRLAARLWPGFTELWHEGRVGGLLLSAWFALALNSALLCSYVWTDFVSPGVQLLLWSIVGLCFVFAATYSFISQRGQAASVRDTRDLFLRAQREYLRGEWSEAESTLQQIVRRQPNDIEARLFLATLLRHKQRLDEAETQLGRLMTFAHSNHWELEIDREMQQLRQMQASDRSDGTQLQELPSIDTRPGVIEHKALQANSSTRRAA